MHWREKNTFIHFSKMFWLFMLKACNKAKTFFLVVDLFYAKTFHIKHQIDILKGYSLIGLLERKSKCYLGEKAKIFSVELVKTFINELPEEIFLLINVFYMYIFFMCINECSRNWLFDHCYISNQLGFSSMSLDKNNFSYSNTLYLSLSKDRIELASGSS